MNLATQIHLNRFKAKPYQYPLFDAFENQGFRKILLVWPRRAGKDICCWNLIIREAIRKVGVYYYLFPTYSQARKVLWQSITNDGMRFLDYIPKELVHSMNSQEMSIRLTNGSFLQLVGSDNVDSLVGTNPRGCVFSEYALQDPRAYQFLRPILTVNFGFAIFISTPRGKNSLFELYQIALHNPDEWFVNKLTVDDTQHISYHEIEKEKAEGIMSEDLIQQEYYTSFDMGVEGSYYSRYLDRMRLKGQIGIVPWEPSYAVHVCFDIGVRDATTLIFYQTIGQTVRLIDCYSNEKHGLEHYISVIKQKPYVYGKYIAPFDIQVKEWGSGMTRIEKAKQLGIPFTVAPNLTIEDGIEAVRSTFSKMWIDENECKPLLQALESYRQEYDTKKKLYKSHPLHDWSSHFADCLRYLCISLPKTRDGLSADELDKRYLEAMYGVHSNMPAIFRDEEPRY